MHLDRIEKTIANINRMGLNKIFVTSSTSLYYLTNHWPWPGRRILALIIGADGSLKYIANRMFQPSLKTDVEIIFHEDWDNWIEVFSKEINSGERIGLDREMPFEYTSILTKLRPDVHFENGSVAVDNCRMIKDEKELELMRKAAKMNDFTMKHMVKRISEDLTEVALSSYLVELSKRAGSDGCRGGIISYGANNADPHHFPSPIAKLTKGDSIVMDFGCPYMGYRSDMTRTVFWQEASPYMREAYKAVLAANLAAIAAVKPGATFADIDRAGRKEIEKAGFGKYFIHRIGHSLGLDGHETPYVALNEDRVLQEGMTFTIEPGVYIPNIGGIRIEDDIAVTATGVEVLSNYPKELIIVD